MIKKCGLYFEWENHRAKAAALRFGGATLQTKERRDANDYISGFFLVLYIHCRHDKSDFSDFTGKKVAATTAIVTADLVKG